jgi:hypothetical protein
MSTTTHPTRNRERLKNAIEAWAQTRSAIHAVALDTVVTDICTELDMRRAQAAQMDAEVSDTLAALDRLHEMVGEAGAAPEAQAETVCTRCGGIVCADPVLPGECAAPAPVAAQGVQPDQFAPEPKRRMPPGRYVIRRNDDGEFGQATGWLYRDEGPACIVSGEPVYVWRPLSDLIGPTRTPIPADVLVGMYAESPTSDAEMIEFAREVERAHRIGVQPSTWAGPSSTAFDDQHLAEGGAA